MNQQHSSAVVAPVIKVVEGHTYAFQLLMTTQSYNILKHITKIFGVPLAYGANAAMELATAQNKNAMLAVDDPDLLAKIVSTFISNLEDPKNLEYIKQLTSGAVTCDNIAVDFETHYRGRIDHLFEVLLVALEVQYGNFLEKVKRWMKLSALTEKTNLKNSPQATKAATLQ